MTVDLPGLLPSWELHLRAERKSPETVRSYGDGVRRFLAWADGEGRPAVLDRASVNAFVADLLEGRRGARHRPGSTARPPALLGLAARGRRHVHRHGHRAPGQGWSGPGGPLRPADLPGADGYLRARRSHRLPDTPALWLGDRGKAFS